MTKRLTTMMFFLLAALPPSATWAQKGAQAGQGAEMPTGAHCGHAIDAGTFIDARARNVSGEEAVVMRWLDPKGTAVHSALFMGRCLARDGDTIDGKLIVRVLPTSLAVSNQHALTAWEADYWSYAGEQIPNAAPHRGIFNENRFVAELDASKAPASGGEGDPDFRWNQEKETLTLKPGIVPPQAHYSYQGATPAAAQVPQQTPAPAAKPCVPQPQGPSAKIHAPKKPSAWACKNLGICVDDKPVEVSAGNGCASAPAPGQPAK